jgi:hypothetical protein
MVVLAPPVLLLVYGIEPFYVQNGVDPFIYAGYTFEMDDLVERYGYPYYAVRFGLLVPSELFVRALGPVPGYFALRWVLLSGALAAIIMLFRRVNAPLLGLLGCALFALNPVTIRAMTTIYSDAVGVPYVLVAFALLLCPGRVRSRLVASGGAGVLIGLTIHSNPFVALPLGASCVVWVAVRFWQARGAAILEAALVIGGVLVVTLLGGLLYALRFGDADVLSPSLDAARDLSNVHSVDRAPTRQWLDFRPELFLPVLGITVLMVLLVRGRRPEWFEAAAAAMLCAAGAVYLVEEFGREGYLLETYYYTSYFVGPTIILIVLAMRALLEDASRSSGAAAVGLVIVAAFPFAWHLSPWEVSVWTIPTIPLAVAVLAALVVAGRSLRVANTLAIGVLAVAPLATTVTAPHDVPLAPGQPYRREPNFHEVFFNSESRLLDVYSISYDFMELVPDWEDAPGTVAFWYPDGDADANLIGSTFLWRSNTLTIAPPGMPTVDSAAAAQIVQRTPRFIVLVASTVEPVDAARAEVVAWVPPLSVERHLLEAGREGFVVDVLEFEPAPCDRAMHGRLFMRVALPICE